MNQYAPSRSHRHLLSVILMTAACFTVTTKEARSQTDVFLLGDSITQGGQSYASYRYELWFGLTDAGYLVDFVGSRDFINGGNPPNLAWYPALRDDVRSRSRRLLGMAHG